MRRLVSCFLLLTMMGCGSEESLDFRDQDPQPTPSIALTEVQKNYRGFQVRDDELSNLLQSTGIFTAINLVEDRNIAPIIAVLDSGFASDDPAFAGRLWQLPPGLDSSCSGSTIGCNTSDYELGDSQFGDSNIVPNSLVEGDCISDDESCFHGTTVAGLALAHDPSRDIYGACPVCQLLPIKVVSDRGSIRDEAIIGAFRYISYLRRQGVDIRIINASFGKFLNSDKVAISVKELPGLDETLIVAAAGNENTSRRSFPSAWGNVISVASVDLFSLEKSSFSNFGTWVDLAAPSGIRDNFGLLNGRRTLSGTSFASPVVAGIAGIVLSQEPQLTTAQLKSRLLASADGEVLYSSNPDYQILEDGKIYPLLGTGLVNAANALNNVNTGVKIPKERIKAGCGSIGLSDQGSLWFLTVIALPLALLRFRI